MKVTPDGMVKVLDFGLAKSWAGDAAEGKASSASMSLSPALAHSGTQAGVILGPRPAVHFVLDTDDLTLGAFGSPAVSPDGRHVVLAAKPADKASDQDVPGPGFVEGAADAPDVVDGRRADLRDIWLFIHSWASSKVLNR